VETKEGVKRMYGILTLSRTQGVAVLKLLITGRHAVVTLKVDVVGEKRSCRGAKGNKFILAVGLIV
jgi:hypothetical protein